MRHVQRGRKLTPISIEPWDFIEEYGPNNKAAMEEEARKEISPEHPLYGKSLTAIARRADCDDVLFEIDGVQPLPVFI